MNAAKYVVSLDPVYLASVRELVADLLWRAPVSQAVECLLCSQFDPSGPFVEVVAFAAGSVQSIARPSTTLFLHHSSIALVLLIEDQRNPFGFLDSAKSHES